MKTAKPMTRRDALKLTAGASAWPLLARASTTLAQAAGPGFKVTLDVRHPDLHKLVAADATVARVAGGFAFTEGPVWRKGALLFSDIPNRRIVRWRPLREGSEVTTFATGDSNGLAIDRQGRLLAAEHDGRRLSRIADDGTRTTLAERFEGKRLNSPNDVLVKSDGTIYFTDPPFAVQPHVAGTPRQPRWWTLPIPGKELAFNGIFRLGTDGKLSVVADDFVLPNGIELSPDESVMYINDSANRHIRALDVRPDGSLANSRVLLLMDSTEPGVADGLKVDLAGNVYCAGPGGVWVCRANGELLGRIVLPEVTANLGWGENGTVLFLTSSTSVYRLQTLTRGYVAS